ncbi:MAG TPA: DUF4388 domain-containing protein [Pyrinomonadaceae bacterium]|nr:DUF4388 domain-containing protein [Pyrinomonadaceae bacterium]
MENGRFVVLTGHLSDYPLSDLVGILRHQRKTGRLLVEYPKGPATLFFQEGELVDAQIDNLTGLQAICVARSQPPSAFNFNPLIAPSRRSIENSLQRVVSELLGCWDESAVQIEGVATVEGVQPLALPASTSIDPTGANLAMLASPLLERRSPTNRTVLMIAASALLLAGLSTVIAVTSGLSIRAKTESSDSKASPALQNAAEPFASVLQSQPRKNSKISTAASRGKGPAPDVEQTTADETGTTALRADENTPPAQATHAVKVRNKVVYNVREKKDNASSEAQSINVVMQIENGRVLKASIAGHKAGMDNYEALALRIARQRRYSSKTTGQETVRINVTPPN